MQGRDAGMDSEGERERTGKSKGIAWMVGGRGF